MCWENPLQLQWTRGLGQGPSCMLRMSLWLPSQSQEAAQPPEAHPTPRCLCLSSRHLGAYLCRGRRQCDLELPPTPAAADRKGRGLRSQAGLHSRCMDNVEEHRVWSSSRCSIWKLTPSSPGTDASQLCDPGLIPGQLFIPGLIPRLL